MNTFWKVLLIVLALIVAIKLSPILFLGAFVGLLLATILGAVGISLLTALGSVAIAFTLALSPIWVPVLLVLGILSLVRKDRPVAPVVATPVS